MATEILRPNGVGDEVTSLIYSLPDTAIACTTVRNQEPDSGAHWEKVDEVSPDEDTTYVWEDNASWGVAGCDLYTLPNSGVGAGVINSVTVYNRVRETEAATAYNRPAIKTHNLVYGVGLAATGTSYTDESWVMTTNPNTGDPWTWAEVDALQAGVCVNIQDADLEIRCTQVWVVVDYTPLVGRSFGFIIG